MSDVLDVRNMTVAYGPIVAVRDLSLRVGEGEAVCIIGPNGAGKTTALKAIAGLLKPRTGTILFRDQPIERWKTSDVARAGVLLVPEGRQILPSLTVEENVMVGTFAARDRSVDLKSLFELFPILEERRKQKGATLSGGEQQMLAIARALAGAPELLLLDEPSMGLAPKVVAHLFGAIKKIIEKGTTVLLVEQNARMALALVHRGYVMASGRVSAEGDADVLRENPVVQHAYLGGGIAEDGAYGARREA